MFPSSPVAPSDPISPFLLMHQAMGMARAASSDTRLRAWFIAVASSTVRMAWRTPRTGICNAGISRIVPEGCRRTRTGRPPCPHSLQQMIPPRYSLPRRPSSTGPSFYRSWTEPFTVPRDPSSGPPCLRSTRLCSTVLTWTTLSRVLVHGRMCLLCVSYCSLLYSSTTYYKNIRTSVRCLAPFLAVDHHRKCLSQSLACRVDGLLNKTQQAIQSTVKWAWFTCTLSIQLAKGQQLRDWYGYGRSTVDGCSQRWCWVRGRHDGRLSESLGRIPSKPRSSSTLCRV